MLLEGFNAIVGAAGVKAAAVAEQGADGFLIELNQQDEGCDEGVSHAALGVGLWWLEDRLVG